MLLALKSIAGVPGGSHPAPSVTDSGFSNDMDTVQTKQNLIERLLRHRDDLRRLGVQRLGLFGSFQRGESDAENDATHNNALHRTGSGDALN